MCTTENTARGAILPQGGLAPKVGGNPRSRQGSSVETKRSGAPTFGEMVSLRGQELIDGKLPSEETDYSAIPHERTALDSRAKTESHGDMVARVGKEMRCQTFPRG